MIPAPPSPHLPLQGVVFDLDGLMVNTEDIYHDVGTTLMARRGKRFDDALRNRMMGQPARAALAEMIAWHQLPDALDDLAQESEQVFWECIADRLQVMPGLLELLAYLEQAELRLGIATSGARHYAEELLSQIGVRQRFELLLTSDDVTQGKPHPEIYLLAAERLGLSPAQLLVLEDSANGCRAAVAAGAYTVAVPSRHSADHEFDGVQFVAESLADERIRALLSR